MREEQRTTASIDQSTGRQRTGRIVSSPGKRTSKQEEANVGPTMSTSSLVILIGALLGVTLSRAANTSQAWQARELHRAPFLAQFTSGITRSRNWPRVAPVTAELCDTERFIRARSTRPRELARANRYNTGAML